ncbi:hypothetical protein BHE74_00015234 [Ensete ventricosum]|nr:hypothetical protein GW17_00052573 [Ensete ventricosum]RWW76660.1 hypothetical protein BHE74_00015234 [Ensete ventricosum]RZR87000.1 hypothetical protein BHM03_00014284 [Ensete ventricosum]
MSRERRDHTKNCQENTEVLKQVVEMGEEAKMSPEGLSYPKAKRRLERRWTRKSTTVPQRQTYRAQRKGRRCKATNSRAMGWQCHGTIERVLVVKGAEEVESAEVNSKYQDRTERKRPRNFIRPMSTGFSSR